MRSLAVAAFLATGADVESTVRAQCVCVEANPIARPFVGRRATLYPLAIASTGSGVYLSTELKRRGKRAWWIPVVALTASHAIAAIHNSRLK